MALTYATNLWLCIYLPGSQAFNWSGNVESHVLWFSESESGDITKIN